MALRATEWGATTRHGNDKFAPGEGWEAYQEADRQRLRSITVMKGEAFSRDYRHELTDEHSLFYRMVGSTVRVNDFISDIQAKKLAVASS